MSKMNNGQIHDFSHIVKSNTLPNF